VFAISQTCVGALASKSSCVFETAAVVNNHRLRAHCKGNGCEHAHAHVHACGRFRSDCAAKVIMYSPSQHHDAALLRLQKGTHARDSGSHPRLASPRSCGCAVNDGVGVYTASTRGLRKHYNSWTRPSEGEQLSVGRAVRIPPGYALPLKPVSERVCCADAELVNTRKGQNGSVHTTRQTNHAPARIKRSK